jgi:hypothetical protein
MARIKKDILLAFPIHSREIFGNSASNKVKNFISLFINPVIRPYMYVYICIFIYFCCQLLKGSLSEQKISETNSSGRNLGEADGMERK